LSIDYATAVPLLEAIPGPPVRSGFQALSPVLRILVDFFEAELIVGQLHLN
jgi:hypothetical protein